MNNLETKKNLLTIVVLLFFSICAYAQQKERRIYLWDTTYSLVSPNKIWDDVKSSLADAINCIDIDPLNTIVVVPFNKMGIPNVVWEEPATAKGKSALVAKINNYGKPSPNTTTDICSAINKFYSLTRNDCINYMFLFTDGNDENDKNQSKLHNVLSAWTANTNCKHVYGFYIVYSQVNVRKDIRDVIGSQKNLWLVRSANINVNVFKLPSQITYNIRNDASKTIDISGNLKHCVKSKIELSLQPNDYYDLTQQECNVSTGKLVFQLRKKVANTPECVKLTLNLKLCNAPAFSYVVPTCILLNVVDKKENVLKISVRKK